MTKKGLISRILIKESSNKWTLNIKYSDKLADSGLNRPYCDRRAIFHL